MWRVNVIPYLGAEPHWYLAEDGLSVAQILGDDVAENVRVLFGGVDLPREEWEDTYPADGGVVNCVVEAAHLGDTGKSILRLVAYAVLTYYTFGAGGYGAAGGGWLGSGWAATAGYAGVFALGTVAINAAIPPPSNRMGNSGSADSFQTLNSITGTSNRANPYGPVPTVIGVVEDYYPPHAAQPYLENFGDDQFLRLMFDMGKGDHLAVSNLRLGQTPVDQYEGLEYELTRNPTLYTSDVSQEALNIVLEEPDSVIRTTQPDVTEIGIDLAFFKGLWAMTDKGDFVKCWQFVTVDFRKVGTSTWYGVTPPTPKISTSSDAIQPYNLSAYKITGDKNKQMRVGLRWGVAKGQYEVRVKIGTPGWEGSVTHEAECTWYLLTSFSPYEASQTNTLKLAMRIKATDQLSGVIQNFVCRVAQKVPLLQNGSWTAPQETKNPAAFNAWLQKGGDGTVRNGKTDAKLDLAAFEAWQTQCDKLKCEVGFVMDSDRSLKDWLDTLFEAGRAKFGMNFNRVSPRIEDTQAHNVQMFTPANCNNFQMQQSFQETPHALRCTFTNQAAGSQQDERVVYADGYSAANATYFETLDLRQCTNPAGVWHIAKYNLNSLKYRKRQYTLSADIEHFPCVPGKKVELAFPTIQRGLQYGRVISVEDGRVKLDQIFIPEPGVQYALRIRRADDGTTEGATYRGLLTWDTTWVTFDMTPPYPVVVIEDPDIELHVDDLYVLGVAGELKRDAVVVDVEATGGMNATITLVDYVPEVLADDDKSAPPFVSTINHRRWKEPPDVPPVKVGAFRTAADNSNINGTGGGYGSGAQGGILRLPSYKLAQLGLLPRMENT